MTIEERVDGLERKLARAQRRNRRLLIGLVLIGALAVVAGMGCGAQRKTVEAREFILVDEHGARRARLTVGADEMGEDAPGLALLDENGVNRIALVQGRDGVGLVLADEDGVPRMALSVAKGGPGLVLNDKSGETRAGLVVAEDGAALALTDEKGRKIWSAP